MIVMQYANDGSLLSYLDQNINKLTWRTKLRRLRSIVIYLRQIHRVGLVHCDLHGGNIVLYHLDYEAEFRLSHPLICDLGLSQPVNSRQQNSTIRGVYCLLRRKSSILTSLLRSQMYILLVLLCI